MRQNKGFTLVELMAVITIIGVLVAVAIPKFSELLAKSRFTQGTAVLHEIYLAAEVYNYEKGTYIECITESDFQIYLNVPVTNAPLFEFTLYPVDLGRDFSLKATVKHGIGRALPNDYIRQNSTSEKWYHGAPILTYAGAYLIGATSE